MDKNKMPFVTVCVGDEMEYFDVPAKPQMIQVSENVRIHIAFRGYKRHGETDRITDESKGQMFCIVEPLIVIEQSLHTDWLGVPAWSYPKDNPISLEMAKKLYEVYCDVGLLEGIRLAPRTVKTMTQEFLQPTSAA